MANPVTVTATQAAPASPVVSVDNGKQNIAVGVFCVVTGTVTYTVEHCPQLPTDPGFDPAKADWFPHATLQGQSANAQGNYLAPAGGFRVRITAGTGSVRMTSIQSG